MEPSRKLAAILVADVAGYSRLMQGDEQVTVATLDAYRGVFREQIETHRGRVVDMAGDSVLAIFETATGAVNAALDIQTVLAERNEALSDARRMHFRIGVNLGEVIQKEDGTVYGDGVNIAARLQALAEPGGICVSGTVYDQIEGKLPLSLEFAGEQTVKNIAKPVRAYRVFPKGAPKSRLRSKLGRITFRHALSAGFVLAVAVAGGTAAWQAVRKPTVGALDLAIRGDPVYAMPTGPRIAVLPLVNMSGDPGQEYFSDGLTEDIITDLSRFRDLYVLARNTTYQYKGKALDVPAIGRALGVQYLLEGSVRKAGNRIRVTAQLIDVQTGVHVWADRYDRDIQDVFTLQDEIASRIVGTIASGGGVLQEANKAIASSKPPDQLRAYDHVLRGAMTNDCWTPTGYSRCKSELQKAIELDPAYARARRDYAWLMLAGWIFRFERSPVPPQEIKLNAIRAVELDGMDAYAHRTAAFAHYFDKEMGRFDREARTALELAPHDAEILSELGFMYAVSGEWDHGVKLVKKAHELNAGAASGWYYSTLYYDLYRRGMYREALEILKQHPYPGLVETQLKYVAVYAELGDIDKAREYWQKCIELEPEWSPQKLAQMFEIWHFDKPIRARLQESMAKAGYPVTR